MAAPRIISHNWGTITVNFQRQTTTFKDCVLTPYSAREWDWSLDGTKHDPGITVQAVKAFSNCDHVVLSRGVNMALKVTPEALRYLQQLGKQIYILQTDLAVDQYNRLVQQGKRVGGLFHSTC